MKVNAVYHPSFGQYQGNPLIEALPPVREFSEVKNALKSTITINPSEKHESGVVRGHLIAQLMNNFFSTDCTAYSIGTKTLHYAS